MQIKDVTRQASVTENAKLGSDPLTLALAAAATIAAWVLTVRMANSMSMTMPMPGGWDMSMTWMGMGQQSFAERTAIFLVMWTVMMVAMMLPSAMPAVLLHRALIRSRAARGEAAGGSQLFLLGGYFSVWVGFGAIAYVLGTAVAQGAMRNSSVSRMVPIATGLTLAASGLYQLTNWKQACLSHCRSPIELFAQRRVRKASDSLFLGIHHGWYCVACCWGLMAMQLALGIMSVPLMAGIAGVIFLEKSWKHGRTLAVVVGVVAILAGALLLALSLKP